MSSVEKIDLKFESAMVLKAEAMNTIVETINRVIDKTYEHDFLESRIANNRALIDENSANIESVEQSIDAVVENVEQSIDAIVESEVDISQEDFEALQESGELDETKTYYIYEE